MTIAMLALAGFPATAGFFGKLYLIEAAVDNDYAWLGVAIVLGSAISLVYYLRVSRRSGCARRRTRRSAARACRAPGRRWRAARRRPTRRATPSRRPARPRRPGCRRGERPRARSRPARVGRGRVRQPEVAIVAVVCALATVALGIYPDPLFDVARDAGAALVDLV